MFKKIFYFYLCWLWDKYCLVESVDFMCQALFPAAPNHCRAVKSKACIWRGYSLNGRKQKPGGLKKTHPWWASLPFFLKLFEFIPILAKVNSEKQLKAIISKWRRKARKKVHFPSRWHYTGLMHIQSKEWFLCRLDTPPATH